MISLTLPYPPTVNNSAGIYRINDSVSGRFYIGSSSSISKRWRQHKYRFSKGSHPNPILQGIWNADPTRLYVETIEEMPNAAVADILAAEQRHLDNSGVGVNRLCMNILPIAGSHLGRKRSEKTRAAISRALRGKIPSQETRARMRAAKLGGKLSAGHKQKIGNASRGKKIARPTGILGLTIRKFTPSDVSEMRQMKGAGMSYLEIEKRFRVSHGGLQKIISRKTYQDVG